MEERLKDRRWRSRHGRCAFLSLIPCLGFFAFLFMGKRSGRRQYTNLGRAYGIVQLAAVAVELVGSVLDQIKYQFNKGETVGFYRFLIQDLDDIRTYVFLLGMAVWAACILHTLLLRGQFLQYLALQQLRTPARHPLVYHKRFRRDNLWWMILSWLPLVDGFGLWFAGSRMKKRRHSIPGIVSVNLGMVLYFAHRWIDLYSAVWEADVSWAMSQAGFLLFTVLHWAMLLYAFLIREDYLDMRAKQWVADTQSSSVLADPSWRARNSLWHIWTAFPYVGGIGIALAGLRSKRRKNVIAGVVLSLIVAAVLLTHTALVNYYNATYDNYWAARWLYATVNCLPQLTLFTFIHAIFYGIRIHWDTLKGRAASLQGYASEFEREADLYKRMAARQTVQTPVPAPAAPVPAPPAPRPAPPRIAADPPRAQRMEPPAPAAPIPAQAPVPAPAPRPRPVEIPAASVSAGTVDINHCTQADYMTLPGFNVPLARRAMEYRATSGGFRSVDEFVEVLQIKPHFAVQIFRMASVGEQPAPARPGADKSAARRRIDI